MLARFLKSRRRNDAPPPAIPDGERIYAIGDVHGRLDLLDDILAQVEADDTARGAARTTIILLGDLVDRGPDSAATVARVRRLAADRPTTRFLLGNHEEILLAALDGDDKALRLFCRVGGRETAISYGIDASDYERMDYAELVTALVAHVPPEDRDFLAGFEDVIVIGDYAFVHAGIRPGVALDEQRQGDLRWIRNVFLDHHGPLEKVIVHGHTIADEPEMKRHRIGIDTGAYETGRLTALGLEGEDRWFLQTAPSL